MMSELFSVNQSIIDWLSEDDNPPVKYLTFTRIINELENTEKITSLKNTINSYFPIAEILKHQKEKTYWFDKGKEYNYKKYLGTYWQIIYLSELQANKNEAIGNAIEHLFATGQMASGGFTYNGTDGGTLLCLTANVFRALVHFGYLNDERSQKALEFILEKIVDTKGIISCGETYSLITSCYMVLPKVLLALAAIPKTERSARVNEGMAICTKILLANKIYQYIPENNRWWLNYLAKQGFKRDKIFIEREAYLKKNPITKRIAKEGWKKFGFPLSYNSDTLEVMYALALAEIPYFTEMHDALELIKAKSQAGRWFNEKKLPSEMYVQIEPFRQASKWLTYRAFYVLKFYKQLSIKD